MDRTTKIQLKLTEDFPGAILKAMAKRSQFICQHCGRRVFAEGGPLTQLRLCRSCFEKARQVQRQELAEKPKPD
ncbi:MAG: hypothetical protein M3Z11_02765 [Candidatus Dormibacteraeota bacterium]|nr:hypothetical protein [Candidatus Dormibacteraeota bacterium]